MAGGVWRRHRIVAAGLLSAALSFAGASPARAGAGESCRDQAAIAERSAGIPAGLLLAIGKRESGRFDPQVGGVLPWPWAVNRAGEGRLLASREAAIAYVAAAQQSGTLSIDVGCFQINLKSHPLAFASLDEAFDPAANTAYAARFLAELHDRTGSWEAAVASYHSATPWIGAPYREAVFATWLGLPQGGMTAPVQPLPYQEIMGIRLWTPGLAAAAPAPVVHPAAVRTVAFAARAGHPVSDPFVALRPSGHLPKVVTPATTVRVRLGG